MKDMKDDKERTTETRDVGTLLKNNRTGLVLTGRIKDGKLILDKESLDEIATKYPKADMAFIALNSPFDPQSQSV